MYASHVGNQKTNSGAGTKLTFFVSGKLWGRSLVMQDKETGSEWSHILGRAMAGPLEGTRLTIIPAVMTNWKSWEAKHPQTTVTMISKTATNFQTEMIRHSDQFGVGLVEGDESRFWRFDRLQLEPLVNDKMQSEGTNRNVVVHFDIPTRTPYVWSRNVETDQNPLPGAADLPKLLTFRAGQRGVQDVETESTWDLKRGIATAGKFKGMQLQGVPAIVSFTRAWQRFHPKSSQWQPDLE